MKLYLIRHGETELNKQSRFIGRTDIGLSEKGKLQAEALAKRLCSVDIKAIYSSDLLRAVQTAEPIAICHNMSINLDKSLREIDFGAWEGKTYSEIEELDSVHLHAWLEDPVNTNIPDGEPWQDFKNRIKEAIDRIIKAEKDGDIVVVSHGGPIKLLVSHFNGGGKEFFKSFWPLPGSISTIELTKKDII
jgi:alpha-ribazole phosphatase